MITSPPYNVSKEYDEDLSLKEYLNLLENSFKEIIESSLMVIFYKPRQSWQETTSRYLIIFQK